jgi:integrase
MGRRKLALLVSIDNDKGKIRLRWTHNSKRCSVNLSWPYKKSYLSKAKKIAERIEDDIRNNRYDLSLLKYKNFTLNNFLSPTARVEDTTGDLAAQLAEKQKYSQNNHVSSVIPLNHPAEKERSNEFVTRFEDWTVNYRSTNCETNIEHHLLKKMLSRWNIFSTEEVVGKLQGEKISERTFNRRLWLLKQFFSWMFKRKHISENPLEDVCRKRVNKKEIATHKPFTLEETQRILHAFKTDQFVHPCSHYTHSHYYPFVYFLFSTGVRNAEAVGLRVQHVDVVKNRLQIERALARTIKGTHPKARIDKETKNGKVRYLPLSPELKEVLSPLLINKQPKDLVFNSVTRLCIDDRTFTRRVFKPVLKALNIEYRTLYACRHGFSSRLLAAGVNPVTTAFLLGNNPETALRYYTHMIDVPEVLPITLSKDG